MKISKISNIAAAIFEEMSEYNKDVKENIAKDKIRSALRKQNKIRENTKDELLSRYRVH